MRLAEILAEDEAHALIIFHVEKLAEAATAEVVDALDVEVHRDRIMELVSILEDC